MPRTKLKSFTATVVLLATLIDNISAQTSLAEVSLDNFMKFNGIPTTIPLGLLSESQDIEDIELVNGNNTFSCHDNFYIVDKCPQETPNKELKALCEDFNSTESGKH